MLKKVSINKIVVALVVLATICGSSAFAVGNHSSDVLVVPSRFTIIQLAFDIVALRDVNLIAYESSSVDEAPVLYLWDKSAFAWVDLTIDEYAIGSFSTTTPKEMILVGSESDLPALLISGASQAKRVTRIDSLNVVPVINALNKGMKFTPAEWRILAERHGLEIKDRNEERRRWGRYGPPKKDKIQNVSDDVESPMPPKTCDSELKEGLEALEAEFAGVDESEKEQLDLPPEDEPIAVFEAQQSVEVDLPIALDANTETALPVVIVERQVVEEEEVIEEFPEDK